MWLNTYSLLSILLFSQYLLTIIYIVFREKLWRYVTGRCSNPRTVPEYFYGLHMVLNLGVFPNI